MKLIRAATDEIFFAESIRLSVPGICFFICSPKYEALSSILPVKFHIVCGDVKASVKRLLCGMKRNATLNKLSLYELIKGSALKALIFSLKYVLLSLSGPPLVRSSFRWLIVSSPYIFSLSRDAVGVMMAVSAYAVGISS